MPAAPPPLLAHSLELLAAVGHPRHTRMFGGYGLYVDDLFIAILVRERLYLKTDDDSRARFEAAGAEPFVFEARGKPHVTSYWSAPDEAMDSPALMQPWARLAMQAALRAQAAAPKPRKRPPAGSPGSASSATPSPMRAKPRRAPAAAKKG